MKFEFEDKLLGKIEFVFKENIIFIYGSNNVGKTRLLKELETHFNGNKNNLRFNSDIELDEVIFVPEICDLKKEITLSKQSLLRKRLKNFLIQEFDAKDLILSSEFEKILRDFNLFEKLNKTFNVEYENYKLELENNVDNLEDFINYYFHFNIVSENEGINENKMSNSSIKKLYLELLLFSNHEIKNKLILLDCPETFAHYSSYELLIRKIKELAKNNYIVLTSKMHSFIMSFQSLYLDEIYFLSFEKLQKYTISENMYFLYNSILEYEKNKSVNFDLLFSNIKSISVEEEYLTWKKEMINLLCFIGKMKENTINLLNSHFIMYNEKFLLNLFLFCKENNIGFTSKKTLRFYALDLF